MEWMIIHNIVSTISSVVIIVLSLFTIKKVRTEIQVLSNELEKYTGIIHRPTAKEKEEFGKQFDVSARKVEKMVSYRGLLSIFLVVVIIIAVWKPSGEIQQLADDKASIELTAKNLKEKNQRLNQEIKDKRLALRKSLPAFAYQYKDRVEGAESAIRRYHEFDTEVWRSEYGDRFEIRRAELLEAAEIRMTALVDHVEKWEPVSIAFANLLNGRVQLLRQALIRNDYNEALRRLTDLQQNVDSDIDRLKNSLENTIQ